MVENKVEDDQEEDSVMIKYYRRTARVLLK